MENKNVFAVMYGIGRKKGKRDMSEGGRVRRRQLMPGRSLMYNLNLNRNIKSERMTHIN